MKNFLLVMIMSLIATSCQQSQSSVRIATFNIWQLSTEKLAVVENGVGHDEQISAAAAIIQKVRPDILVINEIDHDYNVPDDLAKNVRLFRDAYLNQGEDAIDYPYVFAAPCNTGIRAGMDFDKNGIIADSTDEYSRAHGNDCFGYGEYPGQYSMALLSKYLIDEANVRTFQKFLWKDLPDHHAPLDFYSEEQMQIFRLSSKSHWDVPVLIDQKPLHIFISHPTPPVFDGPEDRNGRRNFDEIKFWQYYIDNNPAIYDDNKKSGGFDSDKPFIIAGDLNAMPEAEAVYENRTAICLLLDHPKIQETVDYTIRRNEHSIPSTKDSNTAQFGDERRVRIDYVLPSVGLEMLDGGVYWPFEEDDPAGLDLAEKASDHRLVWIDVRF